jgi:O-methyltransferase
MNLQLARFLKKHVRPAVRAMGFDIVRIMPPPPILGFPADFTSHHTSIVNAVKDYTMTSPERIYSLIEAVRYITRRNIPGSIVECGVWRGGSMMAVALALQSLNVSARDLHLFDTFEGMPRPQDVDVNLYGNSAISIFAENQIGADSSDYCRATLPDVQAAMASTGYDGAKIHFHKGKVEVTIPAAAPESIALLRLDTDWYESTRHELEHLYPRLARGGILIIDDYGDWQGSRKATDEYIEKHALSLFLCRIDHTGRIAIKIE